MHIAILLVVAVGALVAGFAFGLVIVGKRADEAMSQAIQDCTRSAPHICKVNGPCNGWPKEKL